MTQVIDLVDRDIKTVIVTVVHMFKKLEEAFSMSSRDRCKKRN